jgi:hypothetical protein
MARIFYPETRCFTKPEKRIKANKIRLFGAATARDSKLEIRLWREE